MPICITGMHRAGTSMIARLLNLCGVYLGEETDFYPADENNRDGYWEHRDFVELNDEILARFHGSWDLPPAFEKGWEHDPALIRLRVQAAELTAPFEAREPWGWKDPRAALTLAFWRTLYPNLRVVVCVRNPYDVALSMKKRGQTSERLGYRLWLAYYQSLLSNLAPEQRVVTHFDSYFYDAPAELRRVLQCLQLPCDASTIERACATVSLDSRHNASVTQELVQLNLPPDVFQLYMDLCAEAGAIYQRTLAHEPVRGPSGDQTAPTIPQAYWNELREQALLTLQNENQELQTHLEELRTQWLDAHNRLVWLDEQIGTRDRELAQLRDENEKMKATKVWQIGTLYWRVHAWAKATVTNAKDHFRHGPSTG